MFSVVRSRPIAGGQFAGTPLGSGFFVSPNVLMTSGHVLNPSNLPHQDGDAYLLVRSDANGAIVHQLPDVKQGNQLHLFPDCDLGLLVAAGLQGQAFASLDFGDWSTGKDIGVAGYPVPVLSVVNNQLAYDGLIFRVARGVITSTYRTDIPLDSGVVMKNLDLVEVNFLFVPGNSGGPVFDAETGRVGAYVEAFRTIKIRERLEKVNPDLAKTLPAGMSDQYIENVNALYSIALKVGQCRGQLEKFGVKL